MYTLRSWVVLLLSLAALSIPREAGAAARQAPASDRPVLLALEGQQQWPRLHFWRAEVNGAETTAIAVPILERREGRYWLRVRDLKTWELTVPEVTVHVHGSEAYVPLDALAVLKHRVDTREGVIHLHLASEAFRARHLSDSVEPVPALSTPVGGALLNYDLFLADASGNTPAMGNALLAGRAFHGTRRATANWTLRDWTAQPRLIRLDSALSVDDHARALRWTAGDAVVRGGSLAPSVRFAGFQLRRDFGIRPQQRNAPLPQLEGDTELPSTVDLLIDQSRRMRREVPPGSFTFDEPPVLTGAGQATLVITDALGRQRQITQDFYVNGAALKPGLSDFGLSGGVLRQDFGLTSNAYGGLVLNAFYRRGLTTSLTAEVIARLRDERRIGGAAMTATIADYAVLDAGVLHGGTAADDGWLGQLALRRTSRQWSAVLQLRAAEPGFGTGLERTPTLRWETVASAGRGFGRWRANISHLERRNRADSDFRRTSIDVTTQFQQGTSLTVRLFQQRLDDANDTGVRLLLTRAFGARRTASVGFEGGDRNRLQAQLSRSPDDDIGTQWRLYGQGGDTESSRIGGEFGQGLTALEYRLRAERTDDVASWAGDLRGAMGLLGQRPFATRSVRDAVGLIRVPGLAGVPVYRENRLVGHTAEDGTLVVPAVRGYERNRLRIGTRALPLDVRVERDDEPLVPAGSSAAVVTFRARRLSAIQFHAIRPSGVPVPAGARIVVEGTALELPVTHDGFVYLEAVSPGPLKVQLMWEDSRCTVTVDVPADAGPLPELGELPCQ